MRFDLQNEEMTGGTSKRLRLTLYTAARQPFNAADCEAVFHLTDLQNIASAPLLEKTCTLDTAVAAGNVVTVHLKPEDTMSLSGKFIYQVTLTDRDGEADVLQGLLTIRPNCGQAAS